MHLLQSLIVFLSSTSAAIAAPSDISPRQSKCTSPKLRKEWSKATRAEQQSYIKAVLCLATKPSRLGLNTTLYDDFAWVHGELTMEIHGWASFLPWHRYFIQVYEKALQKDCGYTGNAMYWDWAASSHDALNAAIFSPTTGFGGNGNVTSTKAYTTCVLDGPFTSLRPNYWSGEYLPHCLTRAFTRSSPLDLLGADYSPEVVAAVSAETDYDQFRHRLESGPHAAIHEAIGGRPGPVPLGDMNPSTSPNDPLFFLHHTNVDRIWWLWQQKSQDRVKAYNGYRVQPPDSVPASVDDALRMLKLADDRKVRDFLDTKSADLCYGY